MRQIRGWARVMLGGMAVVSGVPGAWAQAASGSGTEPPAGQSAVLTVTGRGVQVYACKVTEGAAAWVFVAPEAKLVDTSSGVEVGSHGAGPVWRLKDGSSVIGEVVAKAAGASAADIPELLLVVRSHGGGAGQMAAVDYVRRSETRGGAAPAAGCDAGHAGAVEKVAYTATYTFYAKSVARP